MRTNIEIDDELMAKALRLSGLRTKRAAVEAGLRALIEKRGRELLLEAGGRYHWEGDLDRMRGRPPRASERSSSTARQELAKAGQHADQH